MSVELVGVGHEHETEKPGLSRPLMTSRTPVLVRGPRLPGVVGAADRGDPDVMRNADIDREAVG